MTVQRCEITDESVRHALPMGDHIHIFSSNHFSVQTVIDLRVQSSPCRRFHTNALWMLNGGSCFFWERDFSRLRHPWLGEEMGFFADFSLLHCFYTAPPQQILRAQKRGALSNMEQHCSAVFQEPPAPD